MAPSTPTSLPVSSIFARQGASVPLCALQCINTGDTSGCSNPQDLACLCANPAFLTSIETCLYGNCPDIAGIQQAFDYAASNCAVYGVTWPATTITGIPSSMTPTAPASSIAIPTETIAPVITPVSPVVFRTQVTSKIDIIMGSVCGVFLAIAFAVGFYGCWKRDRMNKEEASRSQWTQTGSITSPTFNPTKSYNAFDIPANFDPTRSFGGTAAHQTQSVGRVAVPGLGMRDLTHLDPRDVRMPNEPPRSAFGNRHVAFKDKDADLFLDDDDDIVDYVDRADRRRGSSNRDQQSEEDQITGLGPSSTEPQRSSGFVSNRVQVAESIHTLDQTEKDDHSPTDSETRFVVNTLAKGDGRPGSISTTESEEKDGGDVWGRAK